MLKRSAIATFALIGLLAPPAVAKPGNADQTAITEALMKWTRDFNAADKVKVCDLFSEDLRYDFRGYRERGFHDICDLLRRSLSDPARKYSYSVRIKEILVAGGLAIVRLVWTLKVLSIATGKATISQEPGMDVFRRQADGRWKIIRYIAYEN